MIGIWTRIMWPEIESGGKFLYGWVAVDFSKEREGQTREKCNGGARNIFTFGLRVQRQLPLFLLIKMNLKVGDNLSNRKVTWSQFVPRRTRITKICANSFEHVIAIYLFYFKSQTHMHFTDKTRFAWILNEVIHVAVTVLSKGESESTVVEVDWGFCKLLFVNGRIYLAQFYMSWSVIYCI
jgi:hypothetical protein